MMNGTDKLKLRTDRGNYMTVPKKMVGSARLWSTNLMCYFKVRVSGNMTPSLQSPRNSLGRYGFLDTE